jgi:hypothetical protein
MTLSFDFVFSRVAFYLVLLVPTVAGVELLAALFSRRVRQYIAKHRAAHFAFFVCALFLVLLLVPAPSTPQHKRIQGTNSPTSNERGGVDGRPTNRLNTGSM